MKGQHAMFAAVRVPAVLGHGVALQHRRVADRFGWTCDNTIGSMPQINTRWIGSKV